MNPLPHQIELYLPEWIPDFLKVYKLTHKNLGVEKFLDILDVHKIFLYSNSSICGLYIKYFCTPILLSMLLNFFYMVCRQYPNWLFVLSHPKNVTSARKGVTIIFL